MEVEKALWGEIKKPTFISGGKQDGRIKNITGSLGAYYRMNYGAGAFSTPTASAPNSNNAGNVTLNNEGHTANFSAGNVVLTGADNAGDNLSKEIWRRVS
jgi:hypothetical protein